MPTFEAVSPGAVFTYFGPPRGPFRKRGLAVGRVLALENESRIVHVRTLREEGDGLEVDIGFLPIVFQRFQESVEQLGEVASVPADSWRALGIWRGRGTLAEAEPLPRSCGMQRSSPGRP